MTNKEMLAMKRNILDFANFDLRTSGNNYEVSLQGRICSCTMSDDEVEDYTIYAMMIVNEGSLTSEYCIKMKNRYSLGFMGAFAEDGVMNTETIQGLIYMIGKNRNLNLDSASWMFIYRPQLCEAVFAVADRAAVWLKMSPEELSKEVGKKADRDFVLFNLCYFLFHAFIIIEFAED